MHLPLYSHRLPPQSPPKSCYLTRFATQMSFLAATSQDPPQSLNQEFLLATLGCRPPVHSTAVGILAAVCIQPMAWPPLKEQVGVLKVFRAGVRDGWGFNLHPGEEVAIQGGLGFHLPTAQETSLTLFQGWAGFLSGSACAQSCLRFKLMC